VGWTVVSHPLYIATVGWTVVSHPLYIATVGWTVVSHPLYTTDSALSDFQYFGPLKDALRGRRFADDKLKQRA
jgi:hypothetical protein